MSVSYRDAEGFAARVNMACNYIANRRATSRAFDTCFEMGDGDTVAVAVYRRSRRNPKLRANLWRYLGRATVIPAAFAARRVPTRDLPKRAAAERARSAAAFARLLEEQARRNAA